MNYPKGLSVIEVKNSLYAKLYNTMILEVDRTLGTVKLDSGLVDIGRMSKHTKKCLNILLADRGYSVKQKNFKWTVSNLDTVHEFDTNGRCEFRL